MNDVENPRAFPFQASDGAEMHQPEYGMTLRDWFAGQALGSIPLRKWEELGDGDAIIQAWATAAYATADAMLAARDTINGRISG